MFAAKFRRICLFSLLTGVVAAVKIPLTRSSEVCNHKSNQSVRRKIILERYKTENFFYSSDIVERYNMAAIRAPKQWSLTKQETITSFEAWRQNLQYTLSLDPNFAGFLVDDVTWLKKTNAQPLRGFQNDGEDVAEANRRTAAQKCTHLELMLGQIANYCPVISRSTIVKNSTSIKSIWQSIRSHYGFQSTGGHFLDFNNIHLEQMNDQRTCINDIHVRFAE